MATKLNQNHEAKTKLRFMSSQNIIDLSSALIVDAQEMRKSKFTVLNKKVC